MKIEIRAVDNGFIAQLSGDVKNTRIKKKEQVAGSVVELLGLIAEHLRKVYGEDGK
jgi:hypothetical protein